MNTGQSAVQEKEQQCKTLPVSFSGKKIKWLQNLLITEWVQATFSQYSLKFVTKYRTLTQERYLARTCNY